MKKEFFIAIFIGVIVLGIILAVVFLYPAKQATGPGVPLPVSGEKDTGLKNPETESPVRVDSPASGAKIVSPLEITGEAPGTWYFEASFPISLVDENGKVLDKGIATAQGDWMTENWVPFKAELVFNPKEARTGKIILDKDNPSDMRELDASFEVPVSFPQENMMTAKVFFPNRIGGGGDCSANYPIERRVPKSQAVAKVAIEQLLAGPSSSEEMEDYFTLIGEGVKLNSLDIRSGTAFADFDEQLEKGASGSCRVAGIRAQISDTLKQFPTVSRVVISINGKTEGILQP